MPIAVRRLKDLSKRGLSRSPLLKRTYFRLTSLYHRGRLKGANLSNSYKRDTRTESVNPENIVWIFCTARSGSTWLRTMIEELIECRVWEEPKVGQLFGEFYDKARRNRVSTNFVMGDPTRKEWIRALRNFVLDTARAAHPNITPRHYLVVKEPDGAIGAPLLMEALPESRMVLLVRDPRDVAASAFDAGKKGSWRYEWHNRGAQGRPTSDERPNTFVRRRAESYLNHIGSAKSAYNAHQGRKILIRYEDLQAETLETMRRLCLALEIPAGEEQLARVAEKHSWENIPEEEKGEGKFYRKAKPGGWREDLTPEQARTIEEITAPLLKEFYP